MLRKTRNYTVVGRLCSSDLEARLWLTAIRESDPTTPQDWGLAKIHTRAGDLPSELGKIRLPSPPALLRRLEGLLLDPQVRKTQAGREALQLVRAGLKPRRK